MNLLFSLAKMLSLAVKWPRYEDETWLAEIQVRAIFTMVHQHFRSSVYERRANVRSRFNRGVYNDASELLILSGFDQLLPYLML